MAKKANVVNKSKGSIKLLAVVVVALGWFVVITSLTSDEAAKAQAALAEQAEVYMEDELYIRAIDTYKEAISTYQTDKNEELELRLIDILLEAGMMEEYYARIEARVKASTATVDEYLILANWYIDEHSYGDAIVYLQSGLEKYEDEEQLTQLFESIRYANVSRDLNYTEVKNTYANWPIPVFNGEKWGYVDERGRTPFSFQYDEATRFCDGYAVVKLDGEYIRIQEDGYKFAVDKLALDQVVDIGPYSIIAVKGGKYGIYSRNFKLLSDGYDCVYLNDNGLYMVQKDGKWALLSKEMEPITDYIYTDVKVNSQGQVFSGNLAVVKDESGYFVITKDGEPRSEERFYDAKGYEGGLVAVANASGKWGFAESNGEIVVDYRYDDACSFSCDLAAVKSGDKWGYINRYNSMMIEPVYAEAYPFVDGHAVVKNPIGNYSLLTLSYYDATK